MSSKISDNSNMYVDDVREGSIKFSLNKSDFDLFHEEDYIPGKVIRVKRIGTVAKGEKWKIYQDEKIVMTIDGALLNNKERAFLSGYEGVLFIIDQYKSKVDTLNKFKKNLKEHLKSKKSEQP